MFCTIVIAEVALNLLDEFLAFLTVYCSSLVLVYVIYLGNKSDVLVLKRPFYTCSSVLDDTKLLQMLYVNEYRTYASEVFEPRT